MIRRTVFILLVFSTFLPTGVCIADEIINVYHAASDGDGTGVSSPNEGADLHPPVEPVSGTPEETIARTSYSTGLQAGYGIELKRNSDLAFVEVLPSVSFPISPAMGRSFYRGVLEYKIEPIFGFITKPEDRVEVGISPLGFRYDFTGLGGGLVPYAELGLGVVYLDVPGSIEGSRFNFIECAAVGARYFAGRRITLNLQAKYRHLSDAGLGEPNPGINAGFLMLGMSYY